MFKSSEFARAQFTAREKDVKVEDLAKWFDGDPVWRVRSLSGEELARVHQAGDNASNMLDIAEALISGAGSGAGDAIKELLGVTDTTPEDFAKRIEMILIASVEPKVDRQTVVKIADAFPVVFMEISGEIMQLTALGKTLGKPNASTKTKE
jgi:hypothetical protein